ncbi:DEKNAAC101534 [Brettanomyces naardenensis]|uniref:DEKNAAC101534 n=1 Tax=Brettanomyces naardenensis TaxID=13370 RepID=A0A448YIC7_BRENA|nr:DEKNAAC101534 [Brettanomyces naardenensis]
MSSILLQESHSHSHSHSHTAPGAFHTHDDFGFSSEEAEQDIYTIEREDTSKPTLVKKVKDFFNPHLTMQQFMEGPNASHSHSHSHSASSHTHTHATAQETIELYDPKKLTSKGVRITWIGFFVNSGMAVGKLVGGVYFHSQALIADSVHSFSDLISDVLTLSTVRYTSKKPTSAYPLGYGKVETFGSLLVSAILLYAGLQIGFSSLFGIIGPLIPEGATHILEYLPFHSHSHGLDVAEGGAQVADINAAWLALACILAKEWLFRATKKVGLELNSKVLIANAWHHRVDSLTSMVALLTISTGYFFNIFWMDSVGGLMVSLLVMRVGVSGVFQSFKELIDKAMPKDDPRYLDLEDAINVELMKKDSNILIKELAVLPSGTNMNVVLKLGVSEYNKKYESALTLDKMGEVAEALRGDISNDFHNVKSISVQFISNDEEKELPLEDQIEDEKKEREIELKK